MSDIELDRSDRTVYGTSSVYVNPSPGRVNFYTDPKGNLVKAPGIEGSLRELPEESRENIQNVIKR